MRGIDVFELEKYRYQLVKLPAPPTDKPKFKVGDRIKHKAVGCYGTILELRPQNISDLFVAWEGRNPTSTISINCVLAPKPTNRWLIEVESSEKPDIAHLYVTEDNRYGSYAKRHTILSVTPKL